MSLKDVRHYWFSFKNKLRCVAWGKAGLICTDWAINAALTWMILGQTKLFYVCFSCYCDPQHPRSFKNSKPSTNGNSWTHRVDNGPPLTSRGSRPSVSSTASTSTTGSFVTMRTRQWPSSPWVLKSGHRNSNSNCSVEVFSQFILLCRSKSFRVPHKFFYWSTIHICLKLK